MARRNEVSVLDILVGFPWWVSVLVSAVVYSFLRFYIPNISTDNIVIQSISHVAPTFALFAALFFLIPAPISYLRRRKKEKLLREQTGLVSIRDLSWRQFEILVGEAYRELGFNVRENDSAGPDGGIDLRLQKGSEYHLVQCKQWRSRKVGVSVVREMLGLIVAEGATSASIITCGMFTQEAKHFAQNKPIDLIEGSTLIDLVRLAQQKKRVGFESESDVTSEMSSLYCPKCGSNLVKRVATKGRNKGSEFKGCSAFPKCRYIVAD